MRKFILFTIAMLMAFPLWAQKTKRKQSVTTQQPVYISMTAAAWEYDTSAAIFAKHRGVNVVRSKAPGGNYQVYLKNTDFSNGTIEFDVELTGMGFPGINFRMSENRKNGEHFYVRSFGKVTPLARTTLQYAAIIDGTSMWDLTDEYQAGTLIYQEGWNHIKLVISGNQFKAYVNDMTRPALVVPALEGMRTSGGISLGGNVIFGNLVLRPDVTEGLDPTPGYVYTSNDPRYLREWQVSPAQPFPFGREVKMALPGMYGKIVDSEIPDSTTQWKPLHAEGRGIVNVSRVAGSVPNDERRLCWLKTTIHSDKSQDKMVNFGFSDEAWVYVNGQIVWVDKNYYGTPQQKEFRGRCTIENSRFKISLKEGDNEIMIGLANYFYGWGIIARLDDMEGLALKP